mmetsp:Transcript_50783/g.128966  ORF Transcript_50783/g.128966 Transcript_50783/m.128966 type:complete len:271 (+) Transcript_50783:93-905(+)
MRRLIVGGAALERGGRSRPRGQRRPGLELRWQRQAFAHQEPHCRRDLNLLHHLGGRADVVQGHDAHAGLDGRIGVRLVVLHSKAAFLDEGDGEGAGDAHGETEAQLNALLLRDDDLPTGHALHLHEPLIPGLHELLAHALYIERTGASNDAVAWVDPVCRRGGLVVVLHNPIGQLRDHQAGLCLHDRDAEGLDPFHVCVLPELQHALARGGEQERGRYRRRRDGAPFGRHFDHVDARRRVFGTTAAKTHREEPDLPRARVGEKTIAKAGT